MLYYLTGGDVVGAAPSKGTKKDRRLKQNAVKRTVSAAKRAGSRRTKKKG